MSPFVSLLIGILASLSVCSPVEWLVHRFLLHPKKRNWLNRASARGHNDIHHKAYKGPEHYYRDATNEHTILHFSFGDVVLIASIAGIGGLIANRAFSLIVGSFGFSIGDLLFILGMILGTMIYYACYEFSHHFMHVIGARRREINMLLGNSIQKLPDGKLRFSKPLLDDICNAVEKRAKFGEEFEANLIIRLENQIENNRKIASVDVGKNKGKEILEKIAGKISNFSNSEKELYFFGPNFQSFLRSSIVFQKLDDHHFVHHHMWLNNLNVVLPVMDFIMKTKVNSSKEFLENTESYFLCPNSPNEEKFILPPKL